MGNHVNNDRRLKNLDKKLRELETDIDKKQKEKKGTCTWYAHRQTSHLEIQPTRKIHA